MSRVGLTVSDHKGYKLRFLRAEALTASQWGLTDAFVRFGRLEQRYGLLGPSHEGYQDFSYAEVRGWK